MTTLRTVKTTFRKRNAYVLEYAICMTTLGIVNTTCRKDIVNVYDTLYVRRHFIEKLRYIENKDDKDNIIKRVKKNAIVVRSRLKDKHIRMFILFMYMFRCNGHVPATDSHRRVGAAQTLAKRS